MWSGTPTGENPDRLLQGYQPAISTKAAIKIRQTVRSWRIASTRNNQKLEDLAKLINPSVRGWLNYYRRFYRSECAQVLRRITWRSLDGRGGNTKG